MVAEPPLLPPRSVFSDQEQAKINSVNKFNNFQCVNGNIIVWRAFRVRKGRRLRSKVLEEVYYLAKIKHFLHVLFVKAKKKAREHIFLCLLYERITTDGLMNCSPRAQLSGVLVVNWQNNLIVQSKDTMPYQRRATAATYPPVL